MANIQTIRIVYHTTFLSEKEYIKAFFEFIGLQILEESFQTKAELEAVMKMTTSRYDADIWLNLKPFFSMMMMHTLVQYTIVEQRM